MKVTFIQPAVGKKPNKAYSKAWCMEPLSIAVLSAITPATVEKAFYDDRIEVIPFDHPTDIAAITVETYTARRAYEIAAEYRSRNVTVVMGGFQATLATKEVEKYADAVVIGEAEESWPKLINDFMNGNLMPVYRNGKVPAIKGILPDRSIFKNKKYISLGLIETSRGCLFHCEFCSIYGFYNKSYRSRPIEDIVKDIQNSGKRYFFFIDDNVGLERQRTIELCNSIKQLKIFWFGQVSVHISNDDEILLALKESGCIGLLIGFESFSKVNLEQMGKSVNLQNIDYTKAISKFRSFGFMIYGTFVFGYPEDNREDFENVLRFTKENKLFMNAFNHLVPFPGTPMYERFKIENKLLLDQWWLSESYRFGDVVFNPGILNAEQLTDLCYEYRKKFYKYNSIFRRSLDLKANCSSLLKTVIFFITNISSRKDVEFRQGLHMGKNDL